ncbi:MAG TPA: BatA domain-containing protein [Thermoanaerobaculia bacterium]|nr:BatA domain-containing protein [Thermoanaerobaculia bacterium]
MIFERLSSPLAVALLAGIALVVIALYWLRPPAPAVTVASTLTWRRLAERSKRTRRWRRLLSLLLSLAAAAAMASALAGLRIAPRGAGGPPLVVVVDTSATMAAATVGGPTRLERAIALARAEIARSSGPIDLYDTTGQLIHAGLTVAHALRLIGDLSVHPARASLFPAVALGARAAAREPKRLLFSDGVSALEAPAGFERRSVFEPALNVGVVAFEAARSGSLVQAFVEVLNGSLEPVVAELLLDTVAGEVLVRRPLQLAPAERWSGVIDLAPLADVIASSPVLRARVTTPGDALALDDRAFAPVPLGRPLRVAIAGAEATAVRRVLGLVAGVSLHAYALDEIETLGPDRADVVVLEEDAPERAPSVPALLIAPPSRRWLPEPEARLGPSAWSAPAAGTALEGLRVESIDRYPMADADPAFLASPTSEDFVEAQLPLPLLLRRGDAGSSGPRWVIVPFAIEGSNLPEREAFPGMLATVLLELAGAESNPVVEPGIQEVSHSRGTEAGRFAIDSRRFAEVEQPTLFDAGDGGARAVAPLGPAASAVNHSEWPPVRFEGRETLALASSAGLFGISRVSWRHLLLGIALAVAGLELWTRSRGITE